MTRIEVSTLRDGQIIYLFYNFINAQFYGELRRAVTYTSSDMDRVWVLSKEFEGKGMKECIFREHLYLTREDAQEAFVLAAATHLKNNESTSTIDEVSASIERYGTSAREKISLQGRIDEIYKTMQEIAERH